MPSTPDATRRTHSPAAPTRQALDDRFDRGALWLVAGGLGIVLGIMFCTAGENTVGGWGIVVSLIALLGGLHRLGRSGADAPWSPK